MKWIYNKISWALLFRDKGVYREVLVDAQEIAITLLCSSSLHIPQVGMLPTETENCLGESFWRGPWSSLPKEHLGPCLPKGILVKKIEPWWIMSFEREKFEQWRSSPLYSQLSSGHVLCPFSQKRHRERNSSSSVFGDTCSKGTRHWAGCCPKSFPATLKRPAFWSH